MPSPCRGVVLLAVMSALSSVAAALCPEQCRCRPLNSDCSRSRLTTIPIFLDPRIHVLHLQRNHIAGLDNTLGFYPNLRLLDLSNNSVTSLGRGQLAMQQQLTTLLLSNNRLSGLMVDSFEGLGQLRELDLSRNQLGELSGAVFRWMPHLSSINFANNRLRIISRDAFENLHELVTLDLTRNGLTHVPSDAFRHLTSLQVLRLCGNILQDVPFHAFFVLQSLRNLSLADNAINRIHPEAFSDLFDLRVLDVSYNRLNPFPAESLALPRLEELHVGGNQFASLKARHMDSLHRLRVLSLCHSETLASVSGHVFSNNLLLEEVYLCDNPQLAWFPASTVERLPRLRVLSLAGNGLAMLENMTSVVRRVDVFNVSGNPIVCNCSSRWLWQLQRADTNTTAVTSVRCVTSGRLLADLPETELGCRWWLTVAVVGAAVFLAVFCAASAALLLLRRRRGGRQPSATKPAQFGPRHGERRSARDGMRRPMLVPVDVGSSGGSPAHGQHATLLSSEHAGGLTGNSTADCFAGHTASYAKHFSTDGTGDYRQYTSNYGRDTASSHTIRTASVMV